MAQITLYGLEISGLTKRKNGKELGKKKQLKHIDEFAYKVCLLKHGDRVLFKIMQIQGELQCYNKPFCNDWKKFVTNFNLEPTDDE